MCEYLLFLSILLTLGVDLANFTKKKVDSCFLFRLILSFAALEERDVLFKYALG